MKILMVSIFAPHFFNWTNLLKLSHHEVYWIDVFDSNTRVKKIDFVHQFIGWKNRVDYPGRYWLKKNIPALYRTINMVNQRDLTEYVEEKIKEIQPDIVQSFVLQSGALPVLEVMRKFPDIKWVYSAWGNDLYFRQQNEKDLINIKKVLPEFDYMFADCKRDFKVALQHGFKGKFLGAFPGGGGYDLEEFENLMEPYVRRKVILIKGYEGKLGRCNVVLEGLLSLKPELEEYQIVVFAANQKVKNFISKTRLDRWANFKCYGNIPHFEVMSLMGRSKIYIGNSISDGMPNTLLEAIVMGAYPIQSNPGKVTEEIISQGNGGGLLIENPMNSNEIKELILQVINNPDKIKKEVQYSLLNIRPQLERSRIQSGVIACYDLIQKEL
ncbi:glycosyl transferase family 1 [Gramella sp. AN32]|nr:glycosyl transferase family 1 [Gramella sp. AN32]